MLYEDYRTAQAFLHHIYTALLCLVGMHYGFIYHYAYYFIGVAELSTVPLTFVDLFRVLPNLAERMKTANLISRASFALTFLATRVVYWPIVSSTFQIDVYETWSDGIIAAKKAQVPAVVFLVGNVGLTGLQFWWGYKLLNQMKKLFFPKPKPGEATKTQ